MIFKTKKILFIVPAVLLAASVAGLFFRIAADRRRPVKAVLSVTGTPGMRVTVAGNDCGAAPVRMRIQPGRYLGRFEAVGRRTEWRIIDVAAPADKKHPEEQEVRVELEPVSAYVLVRTSPAGASLSLNGRVIGSTPLVLSGIAPGDYVAELTMPGYGSQSVNWHVEDARPVLVEADMKSSVAALSVTSEPSGAMVYIDNVQVGVTPYRGELTAGRCVLRLESPGYVAEQQTVALERGETASRAFTLTPLPCSLEITSDPSGAEVTVDDVRIGVTPADLTGVAAGIHRIGLSLPGYDSISADVEIAAGSHEPLAYELVRSTGRAVFYVSPAGTVVSIDGVEIGTAEEDAGGGLKPVVADMLAPGRRKVEYSHPRSKVKHTEFLVVGKGSSLNCRYQLWVPDCEIVRVGGETENGVFISETPEGVKFSPSPGISYLIPRKLISEIRRYSK